MFAVVLKIYIILIIGTKITTVVKVNIIKKIKPVTDNINKKRQRIYGTKRKQLTFFIYKFDSSSC